MSSTVVTEPGAAIVAGFGATRIVRVDCAGAGAATYARVTMTATRLSTRRPTGRTSRRQCIVMATNRRSPYATRDVPTR